MSSSTTSALLPYASTTLPTSPAAVHTMLPASSSLPPPASMVMRRRLQPDDRPMTRAGTSAGALGSVKPSFSFILLFCR